MMLIYATRSVTIRVVLGNSQFRIELISIHTATPPIFASQRRILDAPDDF
jgi:hypothetical protein